MPVTSDLDRAHLDYVARSFEQQQLVRDEMRRQARADRTNAARAALHALLLRPWRAAVFCSDSVRLVGGGIAAAVASWWRAWAARVARRQAMADLGAMSDRELWDLGLRRSEIYWATHHGRPDRSKPARVPTAIATSIAPITTPRPDPKSGRETTTNPTKRAA